MSRFHRLIASTGSSGSNRLQQIQRFWLATTPKPRLDPTTKRPNEKCDPYGQNGKPLRRTDAEPLLATIDSEWTLQHGEKGEVPLSLRRDFQHADFLSGARFLHKLAAVCVVHNHYGQLALNRTIVKKQWRVISTVILQTTVLGGLSTHDFHLAMEMDVESERTGTKELLLPTNLEA